jgi:putative DNA methylase
MPDRIAFADRALDQSTGGRILLGAAAEAVEKVLRHGEPERYRLHAWCVMPNHVHALVTPTAPQTLDAVVKSWQSFSAQEVNRVLRRIGPVWQANYFDRYMRDEEQFAATLDYIEMNPAAAGLVEFPWEWRWSSAYREV